MPGVIQTEDIAAAYEDVRNDKTETNYVYLTYESDTSDKLKIGATGKGGLPELSEHLKDDKAGFAYLRMLVGNDPLSQRTKFLLITWIGPNVKVMRKAKMSVHSTDVKKVMSAFAVEVQASGLADLKEEVLVQKLKKAMGANYDRQNSEY
ncbi:hypothetical protein BCR44DRAFT_1417390 [Catenaria anguillulae PL171]|uniref:ADF-H domain-containing protein n=1 Tax=Catenaria anguillulae PL171 TaxID=765915 RepID=A0A1Y2H9B8_9FUNG|nr:hypothetical protein BCR44DRAFT_1417390 [Catenaria anguillulae PL171]